MTTPARTLVLNALGDTFISPLSPSEASTLDTEYKSIISPPLQSSQSVRASLFSFTPSQNIPNFAQSCEEYVKKAIPSEKLPAVLFILDSLSTTAGTFLFTGFLSPFPALSLKDRVSALAAIQNSKLELLSVLHRAFYSVVMINAWGTSLSNPVFKGWYNDDSLREAKGDNKSSDTVKQSQKDDRHTWRPQFISKDLDSFDCDVVIVGSGCGGGLMAAELSKAGHKVLLVEKGKYKHHSDYDMEQRSGILEMFSMGILDRFQSENGAISVMSGECWGGGSSVNWSASFKLPEAQRKEWAYEYGLKHILSKEFDKGAEIIFDRIGCTTADLVHNIPNQIFIDGCKAAGLEVKDIDQNTGGAKHNCGFCTIGCVNGTKNSTPVTWIRDAANNGCTFLDDYHVSKVLHKNEVASGLIGVRNGKQFKVNTKKAVIISCGSIQTPALLLRSKFSNLNSHVGKHLRLHPVSTCFGVFPNRLTKPHEGAIMTVVSSFLDTEGHGYRLEVPVNHPSIYCLMNRWRSSAEQKRRMLLWPHISSIITLVSDVDSEGRIWIDSKGEPRLDWNIGEKDAKSEIEGIISSLKIFLASGASEVWTNLFDIDSFKRPLDMTYPQILESAELIAYIKLIRDTGVKPQRSAIFSAHQMGSVRMSSDPKQGAVSPGGQLYGTKKLYVADASVFPTCSGVNPMVTTYSVAYSIAQSIKKNLKCADQVSKL